MALQTTDGLVVPNFSDIQDRVGEGVYKVRILDSKVDTWAGTDKRPSATTYVKWTLETFGEAEDRNNGRQVFHTTPVEGGGAFKLQDFYRAAMGQDCTGPFDPTMLHGHEVEITVGLRKDKPEYTEVKSVRSLNH